MCLPVNGYQTGGGLEKRRNRNKTDTHEKHRQKLMELNLLGKLQTTIFLNDPVDVCVAN